MIPSDVIAPESIVPENVTLALLNVAAVVVPDFIIKLLLELVNDPYCVPPSFKNISPPSASNVISPATSIVKSPDDKSISLPSIVKLSTFIPASAVTTPLNVAAPASLISNVRAVILLLPSSPLKIISLSFTKELITKSLLLFVKVPIPVPFDLITIPVASAASNSI